MEARTKEHNTFQLLKEKELSNENLTTSTNILQEFLKIKTFSDKGKLRKSVTSRLTLKRQLKEVLRNRKKMIKKGILEHQDRRNSVANKNINKYSKYSFP